MLNEASVHLWTLGNNSYARKSSPTIIDLFKVNNINTRKTSKVCSKLPIKKLKRRSTISFPVFSVFSRAQCFVISRKSLRQSTSQCIPDLFSKNTCSHELCIYNVFDKYFYLRCITI